MEYQVSTESKKSIIRHIPNALTIARLVMTVIFLIMIVLAGRMEDAKPANYLLVVFVLFVVAGLTDIVDGYLARKFEATSKLGRILDPLADKFLVCGAFVCFAIVGQPILAVFDFSPPVMIALQWGTAIVITVRELTVTIMRHLAESRGVEFGAIASGKLKMFLQSFGIGTVIIGWAYVSRPWGDWITLVTYLLMIAATVYSGIESIRRPISQPEARAQG